MTRATAIYCQRDRTMLIAKGDESVSLPVDEALELASAIVNALRGPALAQLLSPAIDATPPPDAP